MMGKILALMFLGWTWPRNALTGAQNTGSGGYCVGCRGELASLSCVVSSAKAQIGAFEEIFTQIGMTVSQLLNLGFCYALLKLDSGLMAVRTHPNGRVE